MSDRLYNVILHKTVGTNVPSKCSFEELQKFVDGFVEFRRVLLLNDTSTPVIAGFNDEMNLRQYEEREEQIVLMFFSNASLLSSMPTQVIFIEGEDDGGYVPQKIKGNFFTMTMEEYDSHAE